MTLSVSNIFSQVAPYERPALSKGFLLPEGMNSFTTQGTLSMSGWLIKTTFFDIF
jgi:hypothetical protein